MPRFAALLIQAAAVAPVAGAAFDLPRATPDPCAPAAEDEVVVCGTRESDEADRLRPIPDTYVKPPPKAEIALAPGVRVAAEAESTTVGPGLVTHRMMVRLKVAF